MTSPPENKKPPVGAGGQEKEAIVDTESIAAYLDDFKVRQIDSVNGFQTLCYYFGPIQSAFWNIYKPVEARLLCSFFFKDDGTPMLGEGSWERMISAGYWNCSRTSSESIQQRTGLQCRTQYNSLSRLAAHPEYPIISTTVRKTGPTGTLRSITIPAFRLALLLLEYERRHQAEQLLLGMSEYMSDMFRALMQQSVSTQAFHIALVLTNQLRDHSTLVKASSYWLRSCTGYRPDSIKKALAELESFGIIKCAASNSYDMCPLHETRDQRAHAVAQVRDKDTTYRRMSKDQEDEANEVADYLAKHGDEDFHTAQARRFRSRMRLLKV